MPFDKHFSRQKPFPEAWSYFILQFEGGVKPKTVSFAGDPTELEPQNPQNGKLATSLYLGTRAYTLDP